MPSKKPKTTLPLGVPGQVDGLPTLPSDRGDETQRAFQYQWAMGVVLLVDGLTEANPYTAIWCEHHEDYLAALAGGQFDAVQVKTLAAENGKWYVTDAAFISSIVRFAQLEQLHGDSIKSYVFCSNAPPYIPAASATKDASLARSPVRLQHCCQEAASVAQIAMPYRLAFDALAAAANVEPAVLHKVLARLQFRQGPSLRGFLDVLPGQCIVAIPGCDQLPYTRLIFIRNELLKLVEGATLMTVSGTDSTLAVLASNGRPEAALRGKCVSLEMARLTVERCKKDGFRYADCGERLRLGSANGQRDVLLRKMRAGYVDSYFDALWRQAMSAEEHLLNRAMEEPEGFDRIAVQLESVVLVECRNAEVMNAGETDEKVRGMQILRDILGRCRHLSREDCSKVEGEPEEVLVGIAGLLSGDCRFAWGVPLGGGGNNGT